MTRLSASTTGPADIKRAIRERAQAGPLRRASCVLTAIDAQTPSYARITLQTDDLGDYIAQPADAFKLTLPEGPPMLRALTVRAFDPDTGRVTVDVQRHDGALTDWLGAARPGDRVELAGMRAEWALPEGIADVALVADGSALPAAAAIIEGLPRSVRVTAYVAPPTAADVALVPEHPGLTLRTVSGVAEVTAHAPRAAVTGRRLQVWIAAEAGEVRLLRRHVLAHWGVDRGDLLARAYWRAGATNTDIDTENIVRYRDAVAGGADRFDPALTEEIDLE
ncbi:siderophore-interacting protein [Tsukamurella soli]